MMKEKNILTQLEKLAASYTPEWKFDKNNPDAGSALAMLIADMFADSRQRLDKALHKHKIQYLNRFDKLVSEPVSTAKGFVQFTPVAGNEDLMAVPAGTQLMAENGEQEIIFETVHDICLADAGLTAVLVTDRYDDKIVSLAESAAQERLEKITFTAFSTEGKNEAYHKVLIRLPELFEGDKDIKLELSISAPSQEMEADALKLLASDQVRFFLAEPCGEEREGIREVPVDSVSLSKGGLMIQKADYVIQKAFFEEKEGCYLILRSTQEIPQITVSGLGFRMNGSDISPDHVRVEGVDIFAQEIIPFGMPLALMSECEMESREVLSKKGAKVTMHFDLDYQIYETVLENPETEVEYRAIMKKQPESAISRPANVFADRISWEYRSVTGWKKLFTGSTYEQLMNGVKKGAVNLEFVCPHDMAEADEEESRIRIRLIHAENIYRIPAVYQCPVMKNLTFSYAYEEEGIAPDEVIGINNGITRNLTDRLEKGLDTDLFWSDLEHNRSMYLYFDNSVSGLPFSLYFDVKNLSARSFDFTVEYGTKDGFKPIRVMDGTDGLLHSGVIRFLIGSDMTPKQLFGREGYVLRMTSYEKDHSPYRLPVIEGIYPNIAKVENQSSQTEYFYVDDPTEELSIKLGAENLTRMSVFVLEKNGENSEWVEWKRAARSYEPGRVYQEDLAGGTVTFSAFAFSDIRLDDEEAPIRVSYRTYTGDAANVEKGSILTVLDANRYVSEINNPFAAYGGCDAYTEHTTEGFIEGILKSRNRIVTQEDMLHLLRQTSYSVREVSCGLDVDAKGAKAPGLITVAVMTDEADSDGHIFYEIKKDMQKKLEESGNFTVMGRKVNLVQPVFAACSVTAWLEKDSMENAYELSVSAKQLIEQFLDPVTGGIEQDGWRIGSYPRVSQIRAWLRKNLKDVSIAKLAVTASVDGREIKILEDISEITENPFVIPVNGEHVVHIDLI
ncbi:MAG: hypothetical protein IKC46_00615 [Lachnospiraceae bacterium]|nr:hypothetical protein [Lachnospiraceae bacterium]